MPQDVEPMTRRVRAGLDEVEVSLRPDQVDQALQACRSALARRRRRRIEACVAVVVTLAVLGAWRLGQIATHPGQDQQVAASNTPVASWGLYGDLAQDTALLDRAEQVWKAAPNPPGGSITPLYAGHAPDAMTRALVVVALAWQRDDGMTSVAFVTSLVTNGRPDATHLYLRAVQNTGSGGRLAVGFVSAHLVDGDQTPGNTAGVAFALLAPGAAGARLTSSANDAEYSDHPPQQRRDFYDFPARGQGAWNTQLVVGSGSAMRQVELASGLTDPEVRSVTVTSSGQTRQLVITDAGTAAVGDLVATWQGLLGVVTAVSQGTATVDTTWTSLPGTIDTAITGVAGQVTTDGGHAQFHAVMPGVVNPGNRIVLRVNGDDRVEVNLGRVASSDSSGTLERSAAVPQGPTQVLLVSAR